MSMEYNRKVQPLEGGRPGDAREMAFGTVTITEGSGAEQKVGSMGLGWDGVLWKVDGLGFGKDGAGWVGRAGAHPAGAWAGLCVPRSFEWATLASLSPTLPKATHSTAHLPCTNPHALTLCHPAGQQRGRDAADPRPGPGDQAPRRRGAVRCGGLGWGTMVCVVGCWYRERVLRSCDQGCSWPQLGPAAVAHCRDGQLS